MTKNSREKKRARDAKIMNLLSAVVLLAALAVVVAVGVRNIPEGDHSGEAALRVGDTTYTAAQCSYFYESLRQSLMSSASSGALLGLDPNEPLDGQSCPLMEEGGTWADYLWQETCRQIQEVTALAAEGEQRGCTLSDDDASELTYLPEYFSMEAAEAGYSDADSYLQSLYGGSMDLDVLTELRRLIGLADACENQQMLSYSFSDAELDAYYQDHLYEFSDYSYLYAFLGEDSEAEAQLLGAESPDAFRSLTAELTGSDCLTVEAVSGSELGDPSLPDIAWLVDPAREEGDTYAGHAGEHRYILCFLSRDDHGYAGGEDQWKTIASARLRSEAVEEWKAQLMDSYPLEALDGAQYVG